MTHCFSQSNNKNHWNKEEQDAMTKFTMGKCSPKWDRETIWTSAWRGQYLIRFCKNCNFFCWAASHQACFGPLRLFKGETPDCCPCFFFYSLFIRITTVNNYNIVLDMHASLPVCYLRTVLLYPLLAKA